MVLRVTPVLGNAALCLFVCLFAMIFFLPFSLVLQALISET